jgi:FkbM family methyltransferase
METSLRSTNKIRGKRWGFGRRTPVTTILFGVGLLGFVLNLGYLHRHLRQGQEAVVNATPVRPLNNAIIRNRNYTSTRTKKSTMPKKTTPSIHPMDHIVKTKVGPPDTWQLVDWSNPLSPNDESLFSCNMTTFVAAKSGIQSQICVHTFDDFLTKEIKQKQRWVECDVLSDLWTADGMEDDDSLYVDIGANIGSCVMEMLLSTKAKIIAFEPHPMNVYNIKKTVSQLGKEYQDRLLLFPVGLGNVQSNSTIFSGHDNMGNSQIGTTVKDWDSQEFKEHLQFKVFVERMDSLLEATKIDTIRFVKMDCQGFECNAVDGFGALAQKMKSIKFEYAKKFMDAHQCTDIVPRVKELGFKVYRMEDSSNADSLGEELHSNPVTAHVYDNPELIAKRSD